MRRKRKGKGTVAHRIDWNLRETNPKRNRSDQDEKVGILRSKLRFNRSDAAYRREFRMPGAKWYFQPSAIDLDLAFKEGLDSS